MLTPTEIAQALPANLKSAATQALADKINQAAADPVIAEQIRDNFISYTSILQEGRYKTEDYLNAVVYVSYKLMGLSNQDAYQHTFPQRYTALKQRGATDKDISAYVTAYHKGKLVNRIMEQTLIPHWVLNQEVYQKAVNVQADLMINANSEKVRCDAANSLLTHLARPKDVAPAVQIDVNVGSGMNELKDMLQRMAQKQVELIESGVDTKTIAGQALIEGKAKELVDRSGEQP